MVRFQGLIDSFIDDRKETAPPAGSGLFLLPPRNLLLPSRRREEPARSGVPTLIMILFPQPGQVFVARPIHFLASTAIWSSLSGFSII